MRQPRSRATAVGTKLIGRGTTRCYDNWLQFSQPSARVTCVSCGCATVQFMSAIGACVCVCIVGVGSPIIASRLLDVLPRAAPIRCKMTDRGRILMGQTTVRGRGSQQPNKRSTKYFEVLFYHESRGFFHETSMYRVGGWVGVRRDMLGGGIHSDDSRRSPPYARMSQISCLCWLSLA